MKSPLLLVLTFLTVWSATAQTDQDLVYRKRILTSATSGFFYGAALVAITEPANGAAIAGIPIVTTGIGVLAPIMLNDKYPLTMNQVVLGQHGQTVGWVHGFGLTMLALGDNSWDESNKTKLMIGAGALGA